MYTLSCLQVAYEFLNREWIYLIYGEPKKTCYRTLKSKIGHFYCYILDLMKQKNQIDSKENYKFLAIMIITSLGVLFTAYKVMKILLSSEVKKTIMEFQWRGNENSNKMCPPFHENNNESSQIIQDLPEGTSLTAIVKPTIRAEKSSRSLDLNYEYDNSGTESSESEVSESFKDRINFMNFAGNLDIGKSLRKCSSSLRVVMSKDSLNDELRAENSKYLVKKGDTISKEINNNNNNMTFGVHDSSSVFEADCLLSVQDDSINLYQCSTSTFTSPDTLSIRKNSSYVPGHFMENFPDLDLSPILNVSKKDKMYPQSVMTEFTDKETKESKNIEKEECHQKCFSEKNFISSSVHNSKCLEKSSDSFFSCWDFRSFLSGKNTPNRKNSKIPKPNLGVEPEEELNGLKSNALDVSGSKIPIPLKKSPAMNFSGEEESKELFKKSDSIQTGKDKGANNLHSRESELSLERFMQLEIATGCRSASYFKHQSPISKS